MPNEIKAVLVRLSICIFQNTRQDAGITNEVRVSKSLGDGAGKWVKHLFPVEALKEIRESAGEARRRHYDLTLPWEDGLRLLPAAAHPGYQQEFETYQEAFAETVQKYFGDNYLDWIRLAKQMHNGTFDKSQYPEWRVMAKNFSFAAEYSPLPKANHYKDSGIVDEAIEEMKTELESRTGERVKEAVKDTWTRLLSPVQAIADKLGGKETIFRDSLIGNVKEIVALIPALNLTGDASLTRVARQIEKQFADLDPEQLRSDPAVRKEATAAARAIVQHFGKIGKRRFA